MKQSLFLREPVLRPIPPPVIEAPGTVSLLRDGDAYQCNGYRFRFGQMPERLGTHEKVPDA
jgi:hypothetical protein